MPPTIKKPFQPCYDQPVRSKSCRPAPDRSRASGPVTQPLGTVHIHRGRQRTVHRWSNRASRSRAAPTRAEQSRDRADPDRTTLIDLERIMLQDPSEYDTRYSFLVKYLGLPPPRKQK